MRRESAASAIYCHRLRPRGRPAVPSCSRLHSGRPPSGSRAPSARTPALLERDTDWQSEAYTHVHTPLARPRCPTSIGIVHMDRADRVRARKDVRKSHGRDGGFIQHGQRDVAGEQCSEMREKSCLPAHALVLAPQDTASASRRRTQTPTYSRGKEDVSGIGKRPTHLLRMAPLFTSRWPAPGLQPTRSAHTE
ncbi:hypothetical protein B0H17DRAFT_1337886 [Mycena rosella]|uniref:Uncharacterized protein n=1 Tax=Mycena rosella TaxID=1033263 RepID=A0AAD7CS72_MYCRO|nr:hypothetical protein B0H17DRAFT_1337886 [Mycena rosella]